ncbi:DUF4177 domain-containing protein ['Paenibacillus yunnanensis' Narsing Rao et al. 2020]|uniref:DUF4177 domain-containing protein n=1 Tax=Paenibacillus tengchongensis TaxID=2608684 RepID=UPI00124C6C15|nr:DUF4177 domain-containing protein [Paenibacillus tengchongensis]
MYQYKFVKIELGGLLRSQPEEDYHKIIYEHARDGWRLFQLFNPGTYVYGAADYLELIFERTAPEYH